MTVLESGTKKTVARSIATQAFVHNYIVQSYKLQKWVAGIFMMLLAVTSYAELGTAKPYIVTSYDKTLRVPLYKSRTFEMGKIAKRVSIGNTDIADILVLKTRKIYVLGKNLGTTNVLLWDSNDRLIESLNIEVGHDLGTLKEKLYRFLPDEKVDVYSSQGSIVLRGQVSNLIAMDNAVKLAQSFVLQGVEKEDTGQVLNFLTVGGAQQVMLEIKVAEMSRSITKQFGIDFNAMNKTGNRLITGAVNGGSIFPGTSFGDRVGAATTSVINVPPTISDTGLLASFTTDNFVFNMALEAAKDTGHAKILSEPTLTALNGQRAQFKSGGEFPVPIPQDDGSVTVSWKEFGVGVDFLPVVVSDKKINLTLTVGVSELTNTSTLVLNSGATAQFIVPSLSKREASSTVELADGQTIGIAGLINENFSDTVNKFPGLGDVPVLGPLFRSQEFIKGESELVILVTPRLVKPLASKNIRLPGDSYVEPSDYEFYLLGRSRGYKMYEGTTALATPVSAGEDKVESQFGHTVE